jgi:hypothetical protein
MQYVLGNMLNGGGINPDGLSLDLQFAADKTLTARRGPTPVFTRGSGATQINAQGLIEWTPENLVASSENMSAFTRFEVVAPVSVSGGPTGSFSELAVTATNGFHFYRLSINEATNTTSMMWVLAKRGTARYLRMGGGPASSFDWDTLSWSATNPAHQTIAPVSHPFGDGWYWLPIFRSATNFFDISPSSTSGTIFSFNQSSVETVMVAAVQLSRSNLPQTGAINYYKTTGTSFYGPRFDHDPVTFACKGLLIEEGRTNLNVRSEELGNAAYSSQGLLPVISNVSMAPDGNTSADRIVENTSNAIHRLFTPTFNATSGTTYTASVFAKSDGRRYLYLNAGSPFNAQATFDLQNGVVSGAGIGSSAITKLNNGWYRCAVTGTATITAAAVVSLHINNTVSAALDDIYTGDGTSGLLLWGAQLEVGSFPTSYIPTTTGTLARSADVCSITTAGWSNAGNDTMVVEYFVERTTNAILVEGGPSISWMTIGVATTNRQRNLYRHGGSSTRVDAQTADNSVSFVSINKTALTSGEQIALNGSLSQTLLGDPPQSDISTILSIGRRSDFGGANYLNGHIAAIRYYKKRLPNAKIQALTV